MDLLWLEPLCDPNCGVTVDLFDVDLSMLLKINEFRKIRNDLEYIHHKEFEEKLGK